MTSAVEKLRKKLGVTAPPKAEVIPLPTAAETLDLTTPLPPEVRAEVEAEAVTQAAADQVSASAALVERFNADHFVSVEGGAASVYRETFDPELRRARLDRISPQSFKELHRHETVPVADRHGNIRQISAGVAWLNHPARRTYSGGLALLPGMDAPAGVYNLWRGYGCEAKRGATVEDVKPALVHLLHVICSGDARAFRYAVAWLAWCVQNPGAQAEVAMVLIGGRGAGKGTLGRWFRDLFGMHGMHVQHPRHLVGNFNAHLQTCLAMFVDEAFFVGDRAGNAVLKSLITEDQIAVEKKGVDVFAVRNRLKIIMATNEGHAVLAGEDERRYFVLCVAGVKAQDHDYFAKLDQWWSGGGKEAFLGYLLDYDLTGFNIRKVPNTEALERQKLQSLAPLDAWLLERLQDGKIRPQDNGWVTDQPRTGIAAEFAEFVKGHGHRYVNTTTDAIGVGIRKRMQVRDKRETTGQRRRTWVFPDLGTARKQFTASLRLEHLGWGDETDEREGV